jgi:hypothetical protein
MNEIIKVQKTFPEVVAQGVCEWKEKSIIYKLVALMFHVGWRGEKFSVQRKIRREDRDVVWGVEMERSRIKA